MGRGRGGRPISDEEREQRDKHRKQEADEQKVLEASVIAGEIRTEDGSRLVHEIEDALRNQVKYLMRKDPYCLGLMKVLDSINLKLDVGDKLINELYKSIDKVADN